MKMTLQESKKYLHTLFLAITVIACLWIFNSFSHAQEPIGQIGESDAPLMPVNDPLSQILQAALEDEVISSYEYLYNLDGSPDYLCVEYPAGGYTIFASAALEMMEMSPYGSSPYAGASGNKYYAGPANYLLGNQARNL